MRFRLLNAGFPTAPTTVVYTEDTYINNNFLDASTFTENTLLL